MDTRADQKNAELAIETILDRAARALGSISSPDYRRLKLDTKRYAAIIMDLSANFWVRDTSDENEDVSSVLLVRSIINSTEEYFLYISNVAQYAFVMPVGFSNSDHANMIRYLEELLGKFELVVLDKETLATPIETLTFYADNPRLFNLIFSDTDRLPWEEDSEL